jgi:histidine ammonia-lyase
MGTIAIRQSREILTNVESVIAIELLCAAQAYDLLTENQPMKAGRGTREAYRVIRRHVSYMEQDRELYKDMETMLNVLRSGEILEAVEAAVGRIRVEI